MTKVAQFLVMLVDFVFMLLIMFEPPRSSGQSSWLGVFNKWLLDSDWQQEFGEQNYLLTKTSFTDESLLLAVVCGVNEPTLAIVIFSNSSGDHMPDNVKISFDEGPYFDEIWSRQSDYALLQGGDKAALLLRRMLTSNVLRVRINGRGIIQDIYKFYLDGLRQYERNVVQFCWE